MRTSLNKSARRMFGVCLLGLSWSLSLPAIAKPVPTVDGVQTLLDGGRWEKARNQAWRGAVDIPHERRIFIDLWYEAFAADPTFLPTEVETMERKIHYTGLHLLSWQGTSYIFKVKQRRKTVAAFKPEHSISFSNHRGEVAAYRLCSIIHCGFKVPHNKEVRIRKSHFESVRTHDEEWERRRNEKKVRLVFRKDSQKRRWLYGTYKEWVPGYSQFPIAAVDLWKKHLQVTGTPMKKLRTTTLRRLIAPMGKHYPNRHRKFLRRAKGVTALHLLKQISNLHVFDLLISNWDRYSDDFPGVNCQWNNGVFVSIDNGASFPKSHKRKRDQWPIKRLKKYVQRFSRSTVQAIRWMNTERLYPILFPPSLASDDDAKRYALFLERREALLDHVDTLIAQHGEENVLVFE